MDTPLDGLMEAFTKFTVREDLDAEEGVRLFLSEVFGPMFMVELGEDRERNMRVDVRKPKPAPGLEISERTAEGMRLHGMDPELIAATARARSVDDYRRLKVRVEEERE